MKLLIGNQNYSSWSLRPWLLLRHLGIHFEEEKLSFNDPGFSRRVRQHSPTGRVPVLIDGDIVVWDSAAIVEYVAESFPDRNVWPRDRAARAHARSLVAEMHAGFPAIRQTLAMNCELRLSNLLLPRDVLREVARILEMWADCRRRYEPAGPFLFGAFSAADAFYAPVVRRFVSYGVPLPEVAQRYVAAIDALPAMKEWLEAARLERDFVDRDEPYREPPTGATGDGAADEGYGPADRRAGHGG